MLFIHIGPSRHMAIIFIWTIIGGAIFALMHKKSKLYQVTIFLLLAPLLFYKNSTALFFIIINLGTVYLYIKTSLLKGSYNSYSSKIKKSYLVYGAAIYLRIVLIESPGSIKYASPFIITYILTSIVLLRSIRHLDSGLEKDKIIKSNRLYLGGVALSLAIGTIDGLRSFLKIIWDFIINLIGGIIYIPIQIFSNLVQKFMDSLGDNKIMSESINNIFLRPERQAIKPEDLEDLAEKVARTNSRVFRSIGIFFFTLILIYIIYKVLSKQSTKSYESIEYTEEREYIKKEEKKKVFWFKDPYPRELKDQIRYYYRKYLNKIDRQGLSLEEWDTSLGINKKAEKIFPQDIEEIRQIYIKSRYGEQEVVKENVAEIKKLYKNL